MSYDEDELGEERGFKMNLDNEDELMEPIEENDFGLEEESPEHDG